MNIFKRIVRKYNYLLDKRFLKKKSEEVLREIDAAKGSKTIYFFSVPLHSNLGDQAQYYCWLRLFAEFYPDYKIVSLPAKTTTDEALCKIKRQLAENDKLYVHSGYLIFDPHPELPFICKVVDMFHEKPITILPQTINLMSEEKKKEVADCFNAHPNLTIVSRDEVSLDNANKLFPDCKRLLWPDVVTSLVGDKAFIHDGQKREGIMFCLRNDGEKFYTNEQIGGLKKRFKEFKIYESDTTIKLPLRFWDAQREKLIHGVINDFSRYQLIITDRYHGTIFAQIANTPTIVISSTDHKLSSGVKWFPRNLFDGHIYFAKDLDECENIALAILSSEQCFDTVQPYFKNKYYNRAF